MFVWSVFFLQVRSRSAVTGRAATKSLRAPTSFPATAGRTPARRSSSATCAIGASCAATTWPNTPGGTWPRRGRHRGLPKHETSTKWPCQRAKTEAPHFLSACWSPLPTDSVRRGPTQGGGGRPPTRHRQVKLWLSISSTSGGSFLQIKLCRWTQTLSSGYVYMNHERVIKLRQTLINKLQLILLF